MVEEELCLRAFIVFWVIGFTIQELSKRFSKTKEAHSAELDNPSLNNKAVVSMSDAKIIDGRLKGNVTNHPKLGNQRVKTSSILGMEFDEHGTTLVETRNTVYVVDLKSWREIPENHPSLESDGNWWN